jgi:signal transduction histidine kinase
MIDIEYNEGSQTDNLEQVVAFYESLHHDLKMPLTLLFAHVQTLERMAHMPAEAAECLAEIKRNGFRMAKLIRDANERTRSQQAQITPQYVNTDAVAAFKSLCENAETLTRRRGVRIVFSSPLKKLTMAMDKGLWERIALNLLANAGEHSPEGGEIHVSLAEQNGNALLTVRDFGAGVPREAAAYVFMRGFSGGKRGLHSGLGLYIVKELAELMGGEVALTHADPGTAVVVRAPVFITKAQREYGVTDDFFDAFKVQMELSGV